MKTWTMLASCLTVLALSVGACADQPAAPLSADAEKAMLIERARDLKADVVAEGTLTVEHMRAVDKLTDDIAAWQARTGRTDLSFRHNEKVNAQPTSLVASKIKGTPSSPCGWCPPVVVMGDLICFLEAKPDCSAGAKAGCKYACIIAS